MMSHDPVQGLPAAAFWAALAAALLLLAWSLRGGGSRFARPAPTRRFELTSWRPLSWLLTRRPFQFAVQLPLVLALFLILAAGFFGTPVAERNFATVATWTIWWTLLIVDIVLLGRMWCLVCPWEALASWLRRLAFWRRRREEPLALELEWPRWLRNVYPATLLFVGLTWLELGFGVTRSPRATAILGLVMVLLAVLPALVFERRSFCRYGCLIGRICGLYSMMAPVEVRARDREVCRGCRTKDCLRGNAAGYPCPTGQCLAAMSSNTYCTVCTECLKSCTRGNVAINLRPWGSDLETVARPRRDEAVLALVMLSLTSFHGLTMTPAWSEALSWLRGITGLGYLAAFSLGMTLVLLLPGALHLLWSAAVVRAMPVGNRGAAGAGGWTSSGLWPVASRYAYPLIAVALMYHLAHNAGHFLLEAGSFVPVLSDPFGSGRDLFGTAGVVAAPLASRGVIWGLQIVLVLLGLYWALRAAERAHRRHAATAAIPGVGQRVRLLTGAFLLLATAWNLWLLAQPMEMRTGM
ncbi:MAG: hypothetical protein GY719_30895 [bacterium]|nr:hypothetical protein [bacterium]